MTTLINTDSGTPIRRPREALPLDPVCDADAVYLGAIKDVRRLVELQGMEVEDAINVIISNAGLGLNQIVQFEREALGKYRPQRMAAE